MPSPHALPWMWPASGLPAVGGYVAACLAHRRRHGTSAEMYLLGALDWLVSVALKGVAAVLLFERAVSVPIHVLTCALVRDPSSRGGAVSSGPPSGSRARWMPSPPRGARVAPGDRVAARRRRGQLRTVADERRGGANVRRVSPSCAPEWC
jgi:hypothetical protein